MFSKIIFVLATVCVVNASVVIVNVYDDDPDTELTSNPKSCNFQACDQLCRRLKFPGGACVNGRCKCDNFRNAEDEVAEKSLSDLEDLVSLKGDYEIEVPANPKSCNLRACEQLCRRLKFPGGVCVNGRCKCDNFLNVEDAVVEKSLSDLEDLVSLKGDYEIEVPANPKSCNLRACEQLCRRLKFPGGVCVNGRCKCDNFLNAEDGVYEKSITELEDSNLQNVSEESLSNPEESVSPRGCYTQGCIDMCRKLKLRGGTCVGGRCVCKISLQEDAVIDPEEFLSLRDCNYGACDQQCRRLGFPGGACVNGRCKCDNFLNTEEEISENLLPVSELSEDETERSCNMRACEQLCRRLKFPGGACVNGRCKCDNFFRTEDAVDEYSELTPRRVCMIRQCNRTCTRRGYERARCVNGICKCYNKIQKDLSLLNDVTIDEQEDSNLILRTNEEELVLPSPRACNTVNCNEMCHRLKYAGGWCRGGACQCY